MDSEIIEKTRAAIAKVASKVDYPIVVASCGRSGSTVLFKSISKACVRKAFKPFDLEEKIRTYAWRTRDIKIRNGIIYKTHDLPTAKLLNSNAKIIYTYDKPKKVVASVLRKTKTQGINWFKKHAKHMRGKGNIDEVVAKDTLEIERNISEWLSLKRDKILRIKYDEIWSNSEQISEFVGCNVELPERRPRKSSTEILTNSQAEMLEHMENSIRVQVQ